MKHSAITFSLILLSLAQAPAKELTVYIGTYTNGASKGIYRASLDLFSGKLSEASVAAEAPNPSFLALSGDGKNLYAVLETESFQGEPGGGLAAFQAGEDGALKALSTRNTGGGAPCHLSIEGKTVLVANYSGGNVAAFPRLEGGDIGPRTCLIQHQGQSVNKSRQEGPHAHCINVFPGGQYAAAADLGTDSVFIYRLDSEKSLIERAAEVKLRPGSGPRHLAISASEKNAYVINELLRTVAVFRLQSPTQWENIQYISTLPAQADPIGSTAEIHLHPNGNFVYGSNRGHDTIAVYRIAADGALTLIENEPIQGKVPRSFNLTPDGKFLLAAGQQSNTVAVFTVNAETGKLDYTGHSISVPSPVCLIFR